MASMKIVSLLDSELKTTRESLIQNFQIALGDIRLNINELQRAAYQLRVDVDKLMSETVQEHA